MTRLNKFTEIGRKVVAVGRNYADHAKELGNAVGPPLPTTLITTIIMVMLKVPTKPLLFMKPTSAYITAGQSICIPPGSISCCSPQEFNSCAGVTIFTMK